MALPLSIHEADRLNALKIRGRPNTWAGPSERRRQKAIDLYKRTASKTHVCKKLHMGRGTLNNILESVGLN